MENVIDVILECGRCVAKAEWCYQQAKTSDKCCEPLMAFRYSNSIECGNDVQLSIATEGVQALTEWERVSILDSDVVQSSGIMADPHTSSWLGGKEERGSCGRCGLSNEAFVKHFINPFLNTTELGRGEWTVLMVPWLLPWRDLDYDPKAGEAGVLQHSWGGMLQSGACVPWMFVF